MDCINLFSLCLVQYVQQEETVGYILVKQCYKNSITCEDSNSGEADSGHNLQEKRKQEIQEEKTKMEL